MKDIGGNMKLNSMLTASNRLPILISYLEARLEELEMEVKGKLETIEAEIEDFEIAKKRIITEPVAFFLFLIGYLNYFKEKKRINSLRWDKHILETQKFVLQQELERLKRMQHVRQIYNC
jgi:hypothetical protein